MGQLVELRNLGISPRVASSAFEELTVGFGGFLYCSYSIMGSQNPILAIIKAPTLSPLGLLSKGPLSSLALQSPWWAVSDGFRGLKPGHEV